MNMLSYFSQSGRLARPFHIVRQSDSATPDRKVWSAGEHCDHSECVRFLGAPESLIGPCLTLHFNVLALGAQVPVSVCFCVSTRSLNRWRSVSNLVSFSRMFTSPSRCSMSASWLKTWTAVWPPLLFVSESGYDRNRPQPSNPSRISISEFINV